MDKIPKETWLSPKIEIKKTSSAGSGMFAVEKIRTGETVVVWGGDYTDADGAKKAKANGRLTMQWDDNIFSVDTSKDDPGYLINHSCNSNTWMENAHTLTAKRNIQAGEEVTADYSLWEADEDYISKWECKCGSAVCRKIITGKDWRLPVIQERYRDHFSPLINKRICNLK